MGMLIYRPPMIMRRLLEGYTDDDDMVVAGYSDEQLDTTADDLEYHPTGAQSVYPWSVASAIRRVILERYEYDYEAEVWEEQAAHFGVVLPTILEVHLLGEETPGANL